MTDTSAPDDLLTAREVAELLGVSTEYVRTLFYANAIPNTTDPISRNYRAYRGDVEAYRDGRITDPHPMFAELGALADRIADTQKALDALVTQRNRAMVTWVDERGQSVTAAAKAARLSRDRANTVLKVTRAELAAARARPQS